MNLISNPEKSESKSFDPAEQTCRLLKEQGVRLAMTIIFIGLIIAALKGFELYGNVGKYGKGIFNFVITGLSLLLGLSFFVSTSACLILQIISNRRLLTSDFRMPLKTWLKSCDGESWPIKISVFVKPIWFWAVTAWWNSPPLWRSHGRSRGLCLSAPPG